MRITVPALFFLLLLLLPACVGIEYQSLTVQPPEIIRKRIATAYNDSDPALGLTILHGAMLRFPELEWTGEMDQGIEILGRKLLDALGEENWQNALLYHRSLSALDGLQHFKSEENLLDEDSLVKNLFFQRLRGDHPELALNSLLFSYDRYSFTPEEYQEILDKAIALKHSVLIQRISSSKNQAENRRNALTSSLTRTLLGGMATVWVDRGVQLRQGMGVPDRVIGSGFFIDRRGYLLTNYHVISSEVDPGYQGYSRLFVRLPANPRERIPARVVGWDPLLDLALLKVEYTPDYVFSFSDTRLEPGQRIYAIGSPGGLESTVTAGIVSATERRLLQIGDTVQIDVPINQGNSGGPLVNEYGDVIGVVFAGIQSFQGVNFAIPGKWVNLVLDQLYQEAAVQHPWLGTALFEGESGKEILYVFPDSPAAFSGLRSGDIITAIDGETLDNVGEYQQSLMQKGPGQLVAVAFLRDGQRMQTISKLGARPESPVREAAKRDIEQNFILPLFGFDFDYAGSTLWERRFRISRIFPGMIADEAGLSVNDPFVLRSVRLDPDQPFMLLQLNIKRRKEAFLESSLQLGAPLRVDYFL